MPHPCEEMPFENCEIAMCKNLHTKKQTKFH